MRQLRLENFSFQTNLRQQSVSIHYIGYIFRGSMSNNYNNNNKRDRESDILLNNNINPSVGQLVSYLNLLKALGFLILFVCLPLSHYLN
jgi:hypothetical protein